MLMHSTAHQLPRHGIHMAHDGPHTAAGKLVGAKLAQPPAEHALLLRLTAQDVQRPSQRLQYTVRLIPRPCRCAKAS